MTEFNLPFQDVYDLCEFESYDATAITFVGGSLKTENIFPSYRIIGE